MKGINRIPTSRFDNWEIDILIPYDQSSSSSQSTVHPATTQSHQSSELTSQGRGLSTTDDSSTLPSHQEESEGCEFSVSFFQHHPRCCSTSLCCFSTQSSSQTTTFHPFRMIHKSRIVQSESTDNVESYHLN
jgi:hypothetical protein